MPEESIRNGFRCTGIFDQLLQGPNRKAISEDILDPNALKRYKEKRAVPAANGSAAESTSTYRSNGEAATSTSTYRSNGD